MDTLLEPRTLSETDSSNSDDSIESLEIYQPDKHSEEDQDKPESVASEDPSDPCKVIIYPTARFLQVNQRKNSSFELLVGPPKRARLDIQEKPRTPLTTLNPSPLCSDQISIENETKRSKTNNQDPPTSSKPQINPDPGTIVNECNGNVVEQRATGTWLSSFDFSSQNVNLCSEDDKRLQGREYLSDDLPSNYPHSIKYSDNWIQFPVRSEGGHSCKNVFKSVKPDVVYSTVNEKDESGKNSLTSAKSPPHDKTSESSDGIRIAMPHSVQPPQVRAASDVSIIDRNFKTPLYRLGSEYCDNFLHLPIYLKECDFDSATELLLIELDEKDRNPPPQKRRKLNPPGDFIEDAERVESEGENLGVSSSHLPNPEKGFQMLYKICNELTRESEIILGSGSGDREESNDMLLNCIRIAQDDSETMESSLRTSETLGTTGGSSSEEANSCQQIPHPPPYDELVNEENLFSPFGEMFDRIDFNNLYLHGDGNIGNGIGTPNFGFVFQEAFSDSMDNSASPPSGEMIGPPRGESPFEIFLGNSNPAFMFSGSFPIINLSPSEERPPPSSSGSEPRIEDVTGLDDEENQVIETIFHAYHPGLARRESASCQLVEGLLEHDGDKDAVPDMSQLELEQQEVLMQPKPLITYSASFHSIKDLRGDQGSDPEEKARQSTRSEFFLGKVHRLTKSFMKLCGMDVKPTTACHSTGSGRDLAKSESSELSPAEQSSTSSMMKQLILSCFRRISSGNRVSNTNFCKEDHFDTAAEYAGEDNGNLQNHATENATGQCDETDQSEEINNNTLNLNVIEDELGSSNEQSSSPVKVEESGNKAVHSLTPVVSPTGGTSGPVLKERLKPKPNILKRFVKFIKGRSIGKKAKGSDQGIICTANTTPNSPNRHSMDAQLDAAANYSTKRTFPKLISNDKKTIATHTDSREIYREKRLKFFREGQEFRDDSIMAYVKHLVESRQQHSNLFSSGSTTAVTSATSPSSVHPPNCPARPMVNPPPNLLVSTTAAGRARSEEVVLKGRVAMSDGMIHHRNRGTVTNILLEIPQDLSTVV